MQTIISDVDALVSDTNSNYNKHDFNWIHVHPKITLPYYFTSNDFEHFIKTAFKDKTLWCFYSHMKSKGDGFCILNSIASCLNSLYSTIFNNDFLLRNLVHECINFAPRYLCYFNGGYSNFFEQVHDYVHFKAYRSQFCDILPSVMCNALNHTIVVINYENADVKVSCFVPESMRHCSNVDECNYFANALVLYRSNEHYDACILINCIYIECTPSQCSICTPLSIATLLPLHESSIPSLVDCQHMTTYHTDYSLPSVALRPGNAALDNNSPVSCATLPPETDDVESKVISINECTIDKNSDLFEPLKSFRKKHKKSLIFGYYNVNSIRYKFLELKPILTDGLLDILFISETKLDSSFPLQQFKIQQFSDYRRDRNSNGGGLALYIRSDINHRRRHDLEKLFHSDLECILIEVVVRKEKWLFIGLYKPPRVNDTHLIESFQSVLSKTMGDFKSVYILADINIDVSISTHALSSFMDVFGLKNVIKGGTCFKGVNPTLIDVILTDSPKRISETINTFLGISDHHNLIAASTKLHIPKFSGTNFQYRSMKRFDETKFLNDLSQAPFHVCEVFDDPNDGYWFFNELYSGILDNHAPLKTGRQHVNHAPFMNTKLRKARNVKAMLRRKYNRYST